MVQSQQNAHAMSKDQDSAFPANHELGRLLALLLLAQVCALFFRSWIDISLIRSGVGPWPAKSLSYLVLPPILLVLLYPIWRPRRKELIEKFRLADLTMRIVCIGVLLGLALRLANRGILLAKVGFGWQFDASAVAPLYIGFGCPATALIVLHLFVSSFIAPITEEIINRAWLTEWFARYGSVVAILASSFLFAIFHHPEGISNAFMFGLFAAYMYLATRSLWGVTIAHAVFNGLIVLDSHCLNVIWTPDQVTATTEVIGVLGLALAFVSLILASLLVSPLVTGRKPGDGLN